MTSSCRALVIIDGRLWEVLPWEHFRTTGDHSISQQRKDPSETLDSFRRRQLSRETSTEPERAWRRERFKILSTGDNTDMDGHGWTWMDMDNR